MARETIYHCAGPECARHQQSMNPSPIRGWIEIREGDAAGTTLDFCSWDCVLKRAAAMEPTETL